MPVHTGTLALLKIPVAANIMIYSFVVAVTVIGLGLGAAVAAAF